MPEGDEHAEPCTRDDSVVRENPTIRERWHSFVKDYGRFDWGYRSDSEFYSYEARGWVAEGR